MSPTESITGLASRTCSSPGSAKRSLQLRMVSLLRIVAILCVKKSVIVCCFQPHLPGILGKSGTETGFFSVEILKLVAKSWARDGPEVDALKVGFRWVCRQAGYPKSLCFCSVLPIFQWTRGIKNRINH